MAQVKLILSEDVPKLGHAGDVVSVKPGYARNYLVPQGLAIHATAGRLTELEHHKRLIEEKVARQRTDREAERDRIEKVSLEVTAQVGEEGKLFGSVTAMRVAELLLEKGIEVDRRRIDLGAPIKEVGEHTVPIRLHRNVTAEVKLVVLAANPTPQAAAPVVDDEPFEREERRSEDEDEDGEDHASDD
jgi:large subunit ribosomal protein L9